MHAKIKHMSGQAFEAEIRGHRFVMDTKRESGGDDQGPTPKELYLSSIIGCSGVDVASLLKKMRVEFDELEIECHGDQKEFGLTKIFSRIDIVFKVNGNQVDNSKVVKSVVMSMTKYCGVSAMAAQSCPIFYKIQVNGQWINEGQARFE